MQESANNLVCLIQCVLLSNFSNIVLPCSLHVLQALGKSVYKVHVYTHICVCGLSPLHEMSGNASGKASITIDSAVTCTWAGRSM